MNAINANNRCAIEDIQAANEGSRVAASRALERIDAGQVDDLGRFVVSCERCNADFSLRAGFDERQAIYLLKPTDKLEVACFDVRYIPAGKGVTSLNAQWFNVDLLKPSDGGSLSTLINPHS